MAVNKLESAKIYEVLTKLSKGRNKEARLKVLEDYNSLALRDVLKLNFDDNIISLLPEGVPPYKNEDINLESIPSSLHKRSAEFVYFVKGGRDIKQFKREKLFIDILETIHPEEAKVLIAAKDKELEKMYKGLTKELVKEAFPGLITA